MLAQKPFKWMNEQVGVTWGQVLLSLKQNEAQTSRFYTSNQHKKFLCPPTEDKMQKFIDEDANVDLLSVTSLNEFHGKGPREACLPAQVF